jgi:hypothetical protein
MEHNELRFVLERKARLQLQRLIADGNTPQKIVKRARIIIMTADGHGVAAIMHEVGVKVVEKTVKERPVNATHWSVRSMAKEIGISHTSVQRIWAEHDLTASRQKF